MAIWAEIEYGLGLLLAAILGTDAKLGLGIFFALRTEGPQREVIKAAAEQKLPTALAERVVKFVGSLRDRTRARNDVVHGTWALADKRPKDLVWFGQQTAIRLWSFSFWPDEDISPAMVYTLSDLREISNHANEVLFQLADLLREVEARAHAPPPLVP